MTKILTWLLLLGSSVASFGQIPFTFSDIEYMHAGTVAEEPPPIPDLWYIGTNGFDTVVNGANITYWTNTIGPTAPLVRNAEYSGFGTYVSANPGIQFNQAGNYTNSLTSTNPFVKIVTVQLDSPGGQYQVIDSLGGGSAANTSRYVRYDSTAFKLEMISGAVASTPDPVTVNQISSTPFVLTEIWDGNSSGLRVNGYNYLYLTNTADTASAKSTVNVGGNGLFGTAMWGRIEEVTLFNRLLTSNQLFMAERDQMKRYNLYANIAGWNPMINSDMLSLYDAANINQANGSVVTSIPDVGPYAYHMRTTNSPLLYASGWTNNWNPHVAFNVFGMSQQMAGTNYAVTYPQPTTIFIVMDSTKAGTAENTYDFIFDNCGAPGATIIPQDLYKTSANQNMDGGSTINNGETDFNGLKVYEIYYNGASSYIKTNNVQSMAGNPGSNGRLGFALAGARNWDVTAYVSPMNFYLAGIYTNTLSAGTKSNIYFYLKYRFGLRLTP